MMTYNIRFVLITKFLQNIRGNRAMILLNSRDIMCQPCALKQREVKLISFLIQSRANGHRGIRDGLTVRDHVRRRLAPRV